MATPKQAHALTSHYEKLFVEKYGSKPNVNRNTARWSFDSMLMSMQSDDIKALLEYYFTVQSPRLHDLSWFFYNYELLVESKIKAEDDAEHRRKLREQSKIRAEQWRQRVGYKGIGSP